MLMTDRFEIDKKKSAVLVFKNLAFNHNIKINRYSVQIELCKEMKMCCVKGGCTIIIRTATTTKTFLTIII